VLGTVQPDVVSETGLSGLRVVLPGTHDTASAVYAVPTDSDAGATPNWCYISSGTWSLMGIESPRPIINEDVSRWNLTNEGGVGGKTRVLKNITGMWLVQECRRIWLSQGQDFSWDDLVQQSAAARRDYPLLFGEPGVAIRSTLGQIRIARWRGNRNGACRWRGLSEQPAESVNRRRLRPPRAGRSGRSDGARQCDGAGPSRGGG